VYTQVAAGAYARLVSAARREPPSPFAQVMMRRPDAVAVAVDSMLAATIYWPQVFPFFSHRRRKYENRLNRFFLLKKKNLVMKWDNCTNCTRLAHVWHTLLNIYAKNMRLS